MLTYPHKLALVTGAGRGIGNAIAQQLAREGLTVICVSRTQASCDSVVEAITQAGGQAFAMPVDVSDKEAVAAACKDVIERWGGVDILVNNAGITADNLFIRMSDEDWDRVLQTNLSSCFYWCRGLARPMTQKRWGRIVNISSVSGIMGNAGQANYAASKAGMIALTKTMARELAGRNITVNSIAPGFIDSDMTQALSPEIKEKVLLQIPLKRFGKPSDVSALTAFLCSEEANFITGQTFTVDGGMVM